MLAEESLRQGDLPRALAELEGEIRQNPANVEYRVFLFQLLSVLGQWDRALNQLNVLGEMDAGTLGLVHTYRTAIECEAFRREVFAGRRSPLIFGDPLPWVALLLESLRRLAESHTAAAAELRSQALEEAAASRGAIKTSSGGEQSEDFQWIADADGRLGPMLETVMNGGYYWVPFQRIRSLHVEEPSDLRDKVWTRVHITWVNEGETFALVPTRYPDSENQTDAALQLSRKTEWIEQGDEISVGIGQRLFATDADDYPLMDVRQITLHEDQTEAG